MNPPPPILRARGLAHHQRKTGGNGGIDGVAALRQDTGADPRGDLLLRYNHAMFGDGCMNLVGGRRYAPAGSANAISSDNAANIWLRLSQMTSSKFRRGSRSSQCRDDAIWA